MEQYEELEYENIDIANIESWKIDQMIEKVKENNEDLKLYKEQLKERMKEFTDKLNHQYEEKKAKIDKENQFLLTSLSQYAKSQPKLKKAKTQSKFSSLSGDIVIKHPVKKIQKPEKEKEEKLMEKYPEFVEEVTVKKFKWAEAKKLFVIQGERVFDKETGEEVTDAVEITETPEEVIVK